MQLHPTRSTFHVAIAGAGLVALGAAARLAPGGDAARLGVADHPAGAPPQQHQLALIEDSCEGFGGRVGDRPIGSFGKASVFGFYPNKQITTGEGGMIVTDDDELASLIRRLRSHRFEERASVVLGAYPPLQASMSDIAAALGLAQLRRIELLLARRKRVERWYYQYVQSFEGIKDPYVAPEVDQVCWFLYVVHLGTRFSRSTRDSIIDDLYTEKIGACAYSQPLHLQRAYFDLGYRRRDLFVTEKVAERAVALPLHAHLTEDQIAFIVGTMKDASINLGAGAAIYL